MLDKYTSQLLAGAKPGGLGLAFLGVSNDAGEERAAWSGELGEMVDAALDDRPGFDTVQKLQVEAALRETRLRPDELLMPDKRKRFHDTLAKQGSAPAKALVFATLSGGSQGQGATRMERYRLRLDLVDADTGRTVAADTAIRKEYGR